MDQYKIVQDLSPNYSKGRRGKRIIAIVDHITAGSFPGCLSWMKNPRAKASAQYLVTKKGQIFQLVKDEDTAWHAGFINKHTWSLYDGTNPNRYTIGIEHECISGGELTEAQYQASLWLHKYLTEKWSIPVDVDHIIGHCRIDGVNRVNDPGPMFPWKRLFDDLKGVEGMKLGIEIPEVNVIVCGKDIENSVILTVDGKDTAYAPVRAMGEACGKKVDWINETRTVTVNE